MVACAPWGAAGEFAASHHGVLTRRQAADNGISRKVLQRLLRDHVLEEPLPGVLKVVGSAPTWRQSLYIATLGSDGAGASAFRSSAALQEMDGYEPGPLELLVPSRRRLAIAGVILHEGPMGPEHSLDFTEVDGIRCTGVARTLCDLGSVDPPARVKLAFEWAWRNGFSLAWMRQTAERLHRPGQRGTGVLLELLDKTKALSRATESALEVQLEDAIGDIPGIVRQFSVFDREGRFVARTDFAIPAQKIAIEAHSRRYHFAEDAVTNDARREAALQAEGWIVRYVTRHETRQPAVLRRSITALIEARQR